MCKFQLQYGDSTHTNVYLPNKRNMTKIVFFNFDVRGVGNTEEDLFTGKVIAYTRPIQYK